ncbi:guanylate-binding 1-like [Paramuricea clavata]|uniref:Guanylate-binding 1-like n=2 Tax=Paramuricea clavata TaxID=317549 RepID=A0A6S7JZQ3_PARCT|nr:guanylate-binding 1-like [Paramuricea clavata]
MVKDRNHLNKLLLCIKQATHFYWKMMSNSGNSYGNYFDPAKDCSSILDKIPDAKTGVYWIKTDNGPRKAWCDLVTDGGGFLLIGVQNSSRTMDVPSDSTIVHPLDLRHWSSSFGEEKILDFRVQIATSKIWSAQKHIGIETFFPGKKTETENKSGLFHEYWRVNNEKSIKYCEKLRNQLWEAISKKLSKEDSGYTYEHLQEDLKRFEMEYRANAKGPAKEKVYGDFLQFIKSEEKTFSKVQDFKQEEFEEKQKVLVINSKLEDIQEEQRRVEAMMVEEMEEHKRQAMKLNEDYNERIDKMKDEEKEAYIQRMREQMELMESTMTKNVNTLQVMTNKNMKFIEESVKMVREEAAEERKQMVEIVKTVQERNAKMAKDLAEQTKVKKKGPLDALMDFMPLVSSFVNMMGSFKKDKKPNAAAAKQT